jgi:hypothetical protein
MELLGWGELVVVAAAVVLDVDIGHWVEGR